MKIAVLGGDGFVGWPTVLHLSDLGHEVHIIDNLSRRWIDTELGVQSLTPMDSIQERCRIWKQETGRSLGFHLIDIARDYYLLRDWLVRPRLDLAEITRRHDAVENLVALRATLAELREALGEIRDLERLIARLNAGTGNARDVRQLGRSLAGLPKVKDLLAEATAPLVRALDEALQPHPELVELIEKALVDEPPAVIKEGGMFRPGYHAELDELRDAASKGKQWLVEFQQREQERTGITSLKVRHNNVFGYFIEITKANLGKVPADYLRKQTVVNGERFITPELKEYENKIFGAQDRAASNI